MAWLEAGAKPIRVARKASKGREGKSRKYGSSREQPRRGA